MLRGTDAIQETSNKSTDAILDASRQPPFGGGAAALDIKLFALRANVRSRIFFANACAGEPYNKK